MRGDIDEYGVTAFIGALVRQAAFDYYAGWECSRLGGELDPAPFLDAAGLIDRVPAIVAAHAHTYSSPATRRLISRPAGAHSFHPANPGAAGSPLKKPLKKSI